MTDEKRKRMRATWDNSEDMREPIIRMIEIALEPEGRNLQAEVLEHSADLMIEVKRQTAAMDRIADALAPKPPCEPDPAPVEDEWPKYFKTINPQSVAYIRLDDATSDPVVVRFDGELRAPSEPTKADVLARPELTHKQAMARKKPDPAPVETWPKYFKSSEGYYRYDSPSECVWVAPDGREVHQAYPINPYNFDLPKLTREQVETHMRPVVAPVADAVDEFGQPVCTCKNIARPTYLGFHHRPECCMYRPCAIPPVADALGECTCNREGWCNFCLGWSPVSDAEPVKTTAKTIEPVTTGALIVATVTGIADSTLIEAIDAALAERDAAAIAGGRERCAKIAESHADSLENEKYAYAGKYFRSVAAEIRGAK